MTKWYSWSRRVTLYSVSQLSQCLSSRARYGLISLPIVTLSSPPMASLSLPQLSLSSSVTTLVSSASQSHDNSYHYSKPSEKPWKPMCLYFTQGKCTMMDDHVHLEKFNHNCSRDLQVDSYDLNTLRSQAFDFFLVLDLEGKVEILEFPVLMIDAATLQVVDFFHRFVKPSAMSDQRINEYVEGKYGKFGVDRVWHDTATPFKDVLQEFEAWLTRHQMWEKRLGGSLNKAAFVTCGNWDLKTKVPQQCQVSKIKLPSYFMEWINLKDVYLNFYKRRATGMVTMMKELEIPLMGSHHLGLDDTKNITRVLQRMVADGALVQITARRNVHNPDDVEFLCKDRIR